MGETKYKLELTEQEVNQVLTALGQGAFVQVYDIINNIRTQVAPQVAAANAPQPTDE